MADFYVSRSAGRDTNAGTQAAPFATINKAIPLVVDGRGDRVFVEGNGNVYTEQSPEFASVGIYLNIKKGIQIIGTGTVRPVLEGGGTQSSGISFPKNAQSMKNTRIANLEIRNFKSKGIVANFDQNVDSNNVIEDCLIHHIVNRVYVTPTASDPRYQDGINIGGGNPTIRRCEIHHIGYGGEAHGIWLQVTHNAVVDGCDVYMVRKDAIRCGTSLNPTVQNSRFYLSTNGISFEQCVGGQAFNNFAYLCASGLCAKHVNDPAEALSAWSMPATAWQLLRYYHNTTWMCTDESQYIAGNLDPTPTNPNRGALWHIEWKNNLYGGTGLRHFRDAPQARGEGVFVDYNVYQSKPGQTTLHWYFNTGTGHYTEDLATLASGTASPSDPSKTLGWEEHGRFMAFDFVDTAKGNLNPTAPIPGLIDFGTPFGSQVGARLSTTAHAQWKQNPLIVVSAKSTGKPTSRLIDDYGSQTSYDTDTSVDEWLVVDQGAARINHLKWDVWGHQQPKSVKSYTLEVSSSPTGPWTNVEDGLMNDNFGSFFIFEYPAFTGRYLRWTAHDVFGATTPVMAFCGIQSGYLTAAGTVAPPTAAAPANTVLPLITPDTAQTGATLTASRGTWQNTDAATTYAFQWRRGTTNIPGATGATYVLTDADVGQAITVRVTASNSAGPGAPATSDPVTPVAAPVVAVKPVNTVLPTITTDGLPETGDAVTGDVGTWDNSPTTFTYAWSRQNAVIPGATTSRFVLTELDVGQELRFIVTASNAAGTSQPATSQPIVSQAPPPPPPDPQDAPVNVGGWGIRLPS